MSAHLGALHGTVVDQDEAIQPEAELLGQRTQVCRLRLPVDARADQMLLFQQHVRPTKHGLDVHRIVFSAKTQQHTRIVLLNELGLQLQVSRRQLHSGRTILTADAFPQRIVTIDCDHLARWLEQRGGAAGHQRRDRGEQLVCVGYVANAIGKRIVVLIDTIQTLGIRVSPVVNPIHRLQPLANERGDLIETTGVLLRKRV